MVRLSVLVSETLLLIALLVFQKESGQHLVYQDFNYFLIIIQELVLEH
jgi:hypothetical protein